MRYIIAIKFIKKLLFLLIKKEQKHIMLNAYFIQEIVSHDVFPKAQILMNDVSFCV